MHNPFWGPASSPPRLPADPRACDTACVAANTNAVMAAYPVRGQWASLPWADTVGYAENSVGIRINEGIWQGVTAVDSAPLVIADATTGNGVWIGKIEEHGQPAWAAVTVSSAGRRIEGIDALIRRKEYGVPYAEPAGVPEFAVLPVAQRTARAAMLATVDRFYAALNGHQGAVPEAVSSTCQWTVNGQVLGACAAPLTGNALQWIARWRDRQVLAVDEARGLVAVRVFEDIPAAPREFTGADGTARPNPAAYPRSLQIVEVFRIEDGRIVALRRISSELPYGMKPHD
jgi:hypothetical protein